VVPPSADGVDVVRRALESAIGTQFEFIRLLGRGGMGFVYLARERGLERLVAIKVLSPEVAATAQMRERFRREARTSARLTHPNILPLHSFGEVGNFPYLVMDYVQGESLADRLMRDGRLPSEDARRVLIELADALDYAHRRGVVHRDIKPENVLLEDESGRAILADFGIAKARTGQSPLTGTGMIVGTPRYMSPEQASGDHSIDGRSDIYSLGMLGYAMLSGRTLFDGRNANEVLAKIATQEPPPLHIALSDEPDDLVTSISRCLARDPDSRWPDGRSLKRALMRDGGSDTAVPDELRDIPGFGLWAALWAAGWWITAARQSDADALIFLLIGLLVPVGFLLLVWNTGRSGYRYARILRVATWPPKWWGMWWPQSLRRPGDLWTRLPASARLTRRTLTALFLVLPLLVFAGRWARTAAPLGARGPDAQRWMGIAAYLLIVFAFAVVAASAAAWRRRGLATPEVAWLLVGPTIEARFWGKPQIESVLTRLPPRPGARDDAQPETPHDYLRAILEAAERLTGDARALGSDAVAAARQLVGAIDALDREIAMLARDADPVEVSRLEQRLAWLDEGAADDDEQQMRLLSGQQLELLRRLTARLEAATTQRAHHVGMLRTLSLYLANLRARTAEETLDSGEVTAKIRALCDAIEHHGGPIAVEDRPPA
jgi:predicted Ser/Thr protein kinase